ncbi:hypothetical protein SG34_019975 [Thalassomonas viridans]|uniref:Uncharacterized protein n=1 Tax=Thalassomonas viridans TaxID=137584 RepID=A0AAF0C894_9GAMM|nr:hypothetical protein [Thalassomonas viridans]WDE03644.1 hypothetical protein SG34_019975 [Thalassomonas viridans]
MITLDALNLHLPPGMQERAPAIARLIAGQLSRLQGENGTGISGEIPRLNIGALHIHHSFSDAQIAQTIASAINEKIQQAVKPAESLNFTGKKVNKPVSVKRQGGRT